MQILFLSCLKATELVEKRLHVKLSLADRLRLKLHLTMCSACANYEKQSLTIEQGIANQIKNISTPTDLEALKQSIIQQINLKH
jgi:predicted anti-sigma-YlaC factor YlaD